MAARLGARAVIVGKIGDDEHGRAYTENLRQQSVDLTHLGVEKGISTGIATIFVESSSGENMIVIVGGANTRLTGEDVRKAEKEISESSVVVTTLELGLQAVKVAMETGRSHGVRTILNAAPGRADLDQEILSNVDILVVNETEAELLTGCPDLQKCGEMLRRKCGTVIITLGKDGALLWEREKPVVKVDCPRVEAEKVVDTTGAGDAFVGSLAYFLSCRLEMAESVRRSCCVASLTVQSQGTQASYPAGPDLPDLV